MTKQYNSIFFLGLIEWVWVSIVLLIFYHGEYRIYDLVLINMPLLFDRNYIGLGIEQLKRKIRMISDFQYQIRTCILSILYWMNELILSSSHRSLYFEYISTVKCLLSQYVLSCSWIFSFVCIHLITDSLTFFRSLVVRSLNLYRYCTQMHPNALKIYLFL